MRGDPRRAGAESVARPPIDVHTTADAVQIRVDLPGVTKAGLQVTLEGNELLLEGEVQALPGEPAGGSRLPDRYRRLFTLSERVDRDGIVARLEHGVLSLMLPAAERARPRTIPIEEA